MRALALLLLLAVPAEADEPRREAIEVRDGTFRTLDGELHDVQGGAYLPLATLLSVTGELAALRAERAVAVQTPPVTPKLLMVALGLGVVLGVGATIYLQRR